MRKEKREQHLIDVQRRRQEQEEAEQKKFYDEVFFFFFLFLPFPLSSRYSFDLSQEIQKQEAARLAREKREKHLEDLELKRQEKQRAEEEKFYAEVLFPLPFFFPFHLLHHFPLLTLIVGGGETRGGEVEEREERATFG